MAKMTTEQMKVLREWREEVLNSIQDVVGSYSTVTSAEDEELATAIYDRLLDEDNLNLPEVPDPPKPVPSGGFLPGIPRGGFQAGGMTTSSTFEPGPEGFR